MSDLYSKITIQRSKYNGQLEAATATVVACSSVAIFSSLELTILLSTIFQKRRGLYFWSLSICNLGVLMYSFGVWTTYFELGANIGTSTLKMTGWMLMVGFQSLVLYSRLGLIVHNANILRAVKWMMIINAITLMPITAVFTYCSHLSIRSVYSTGYYYAQHVQIIVFNVQENLISAIYIFQSITLLNIIETTKSRTLIWQLVMLSLVVILLDAAVTVLICLNIMTYQEAVKAVAYAVKLKFEMFILTKLVDFVRENQLRRSSIINVVQDSIPVIGQGHVGFPQATLVVQTQNPLSPVDSHESSSVSPTQGGAPGSRWAKAPSSHLSEDSTIVQSTSVPTVEMSQRLKGREDEIMYADIIRSLK